MSDRTASYQSSLTASGYLQALERMEIPERIKWLEGLLCRPLEDGVRPVLVRHYLNLTDRDGMPVSDSNLTQGEDA